MSEHDAPGGNHPPTGDEPMTVRRPPSDAPSSAVTPPRVPSGATTAHVAGQPPVAPPAYPQPPLIPAGRPEHVPQEHVPQGHVQRPLGPDGRPLIETLPPLPEHPADVPLSPSTGQPRRNPVMLVSITFLYAASVAAAVGFALFWWKAIYITEFAQSARLLTWTDPRPGSWQSMALSGVVALVTIAVVTAPAVAAFQAWNGHRWSRIAGLIAIGVSLLTILMNTPALLAIPLTAIGAGALWLPPVKRYFEHWERFRADDEPRPHRPESVRYGPLDRYLADESPNVTAPR